MPTQPSRCREQVLKGAYSAIRQATYRRRQVHSLIAVHRDKARFDAGVVWWLETVELVQMAADQQVDRYEGDPWEEVIAPWVESQSSVSISEVLERRLQKLQAL